MEIARERFLDLTREFHLTLSLRSRTAAMHSALTALTEDERSRVSAVLAHALDEIAVIVGPHVGEVSPR